MANSLHFNGVDLSGSSYGVKVHKWPVPVAGPLRIAQHELAQRHGAHVYAKWLAPLELSVSVGISGSSLADLQSKCDVLMGVLAMTTGPKTLRFDGWQNDRFRYAYYKGGTLAPFFGGYMETELVFLCADPRAYAATATTQTVNPLSGSAFSVPAAGNLAGNAYAEPVWTFRNTGAAITELTLANATTDEGITVYHSIAENAYVRFDFPRQAVEYSEDGTTWTRIMSSIDAALKHIPRLAPGVSNSISYGGITTGTCSIVYRATYL